MIFSKKYFLFITVAVLFTINGYSQFSDSVHHYIAGNLSGNINRSNGTTYLFNNGIKYRMRKRQAELNANSNWVYGENPSKKTNNDFISTLDFNIYPKKNEKLNYWGLGSFTRSFSLNIHSQWQGGFGAAYKVVDKPYLFVRISNGFLFEQSAVILKDTITHYNTFRNSLRLQLRSNFSKIISFEATGFWQPSLQYKNDYIYSGQAGLNVKLNKWVSLTTRLNYNRISRTEKENLLFTYGITLDQYF